MFNIWDYENKENFRMHVGNITKAEILEWTSNKENLTKVLFNYGKIDKFNITIYSENIDKNVYIYLEYSKPNYDYQPITKGMEDKNLWTILMEISKTEKKPFHVRSE